MPVPISELFVTVGADISGFTSAMSSVSQSVQKMGNTLQAAGRDLSAGLTVPIVGAAAVVTGVGSTFEHAFTGVAKTVDNLSPDELVAFRNALIDLSTVQAGGGKTATQLANIAETAGQIGIAKDNLLDFTKTVAQLSLTTQIDPSQLAEPLARIGLLTDSQKDFERLGSAITALGNELPGTEKDILDIATRSAGALHTLGVSAQDVLGIASAASAIGVEPEAAGTAIQRVFLGIGQAVAGISQDTPEAAKKIQTLQDRITDLGTSLATATQRQAQFGRNTPASEVQATAGAIEKYKREIAQAQAELAGLTTNKPDQALQALADTTGLTADQFKDLFKTDPAKAFTALIHGLAAIKDQSTLIRTLKALGFENEREITLLLGLAQTADQLDKALSVSNTAFQDNVATQNEVQKAFDDTQNRFDLMTQKINAELIRAWFDLKPAVANVMDQFEQRVMPLLKQAVTWFTALSPEMQTSIVVFGGLAAALGPVLVLLGVLVTSIGALFSPIAIAAALVGLLAAAWITNWGDIRDKAGAAILAISGFLNNDLGKALQVATVLSLIAATVIGTQLAFMGVAWVKASAVAIANALKIAAAWLIAAAPAIGVAALIIGAIVGIVAIVAFFRKAWDENFLGMQEPIANLVNTIGDLFGLLAKLPSFTFGGMTQKDWQDQADAAHQFFDRVKQGQSAIPQLQGVADSLDLGQSFLDQFKAGFPDVQRQIQGAFNTGLTDVTPSLTSAGVPQDALTAAMQQAMGPQPVAGQPAGNSVNVTITNPVVLDDSMLTQMNNQISDALISALISAERATVPLPQPSLVPGQPF